MDVAEHAFNSWNHWTLRWAVWPIKTRYSGLRRRWWSPYSRELIKVLLEVIEEYEISSKLGYLIMDNASNNDTLVEHLSQGFELLT